MKSQSLFSNEKIIMPTFLKRKEKKIRENWGFISFELKLWLKVKVIEIEMKKKSKRKIIFLYVLYKDNFFYKKVNKYAFGKVEIFVRKL